MDFIYDYFLVPLMRNGWFNPVNSLVYGIILIAGIWFVYKLLRKADVPIDSRLYLAFIPFIAFAGVTRTLRDYIYFSASSQPGFLSSFSGHMSAMQQSAYDHVFSITGNHMIAYLDSYIIAWFPTPGSYLITFILALFSLFVALSARRYIGTSCWSIMFIIGSVLFVANVTLLPLNRTEPLLYIGLVTAAWAVLFFSLGRSSEVLGKMNRKLGRITKKIFSPVNSTVISAHFFDATATFFAIAVFSTLGGHGYIEQHFLSRWMMPFLGPQVMFLLKFIVVIPVLYYIDRHIDEKEMANFLKLVVFVLGAAPATRNLVRLIVGV